MKYFFSLLLIINCFSISSQTIPIYGEVPTAIILTKSLLKNIEKNKINQLDHTHVYVGDGRSQELFYHALSPKDQINGVLVLFPPTGQSTEQVFNHNTHLMERAHEDGILVIIPSINYNLYLDSISLKFINTVIIEANKKFDTKNQKVVLGGFSLGGMNAIRYAEIAFEGKTKTAIQPTAVYAVDSPLDFERLYYSFERTLQKNFHKGAMYEAKSYLDKLNAQFGGHPTEFLEAYTENSMFSKSADQGGNARYLKKMPIRIYTDLDLEWHLNERHNDLYDINALDQTAFINQLKLLGNENAELINAVGKGYRLDGRRHPHSWSIVDVEDCMKWILKQVK